VDRNQLVNRINRQLDLPLALLSLVMLVLVLVDLLVEVPAGTRVWLERVNWALWSVFAIEYLVKLSVSEGKREYLRSHWFDALVLVVPTFRVVRALRILRVAKAFPLFRLAAFMGMGVRGVASFFARYQLGYLLALTTLVTLGCAAAVFLLERDLPGTRFVTFGDSLWWSAALMTTVASDLNPQTAWGRVIAVAEMVYSMAIFVYLMGAVANDLLRTKTPEPTTPTVQRGVKELEGKAPAPRKAPEPPTRPKPPSRAV
jgi:voltage-gated potassium channel